MIDISNFNQNFGNLIGRDYNIVNIAKLSILTNQGLSISADYIQGANIWKPY